MQEDEEPNPGTTVPGRIRELEEDAQTQNESKRMRSTTDEAPTEHPWVRNTYAHAYTQAFQRTGMPAADILSAVQRTCR